MKSFLVLLAVSIVFISCSSSEKKEVDKNIVRVRVLEDADQINAMNSRNETSKMIVENIFQTLVNTDRRNYSIVPVLAKERPIVEIDKDGQMILHFEIRKEAVWPNGSPVLASDVVFSVKTVKNPLTNCHFRKPYLEFVHDIVIDANNPRKFKVVSKTPYHLGETSMDALYIIPEYFYDEKGLMSDFTIQDLSKSGIEENEAIIAFANHFNSEIFQRQKICGSGAYSFSKWNTNQRIVLSKKENWWGDQFMEENMYFEAHPNKLEFIVIPDMNTAIAALKQDEIDVMRRISLREFAEVLPNDPSITSKYDLLKPAKFSYDYIGFNTQDEILSDRALRKALSQMVNIDEFIDKLCFGLAERTVGFIHPAKKRLYNDTLKLIPFDLEKLNNDLDSLGWNQKDENGIRFKEINGETKKLSFEHLFPSASAPRKRFAIILQDAGKKAGVELKLVGLETKLFLQRLGKHDFDTYHSGWITGPGESDPKQIWHTESIEGSNYVSYGSAYSDSLIETLRMTMDFDKRANIYRELQADIYNEAPYVFMMCVNERLAVSKKFSNVYGTGIRPGFWLGSFRRNWLKD